MTEWQKTVIWTYCKSRSLAEAGAALGISKQRVQQIVAKHAPQRMRAWGSGKLPDLAATSAAAAAREVIALEGL